MKNLTLKALINDVEIARRNFQNADPDYVDIAIYELMAAEEKLNEYIREQKKKEVIKKTFQPPTEKVK